MSAAFGGARASIRTRVDRSNRLFGSVVGALVYISLGYRVLGFLYVGLDRLLRSGAGHL